MLIHHSDGTWTGCWINSRSFLVSSEGICFLKNASTVVPVLLRCDLSAAGVACTIECLWTRLSFDGWPGFLRVGLWLGILGLWGCDCCHDIFVSCRTPAVFPPTSAFYSELNLFLLWQKMKTLISQEEPSRKVTRFAVPFLLLMHQLRFKLPQKNLVHSACKNKFLVSAERIISHSGPPRGQPDLSPRLEWRTRSHSDGGKTKLRGFTCLPLSVFQGKVAQTACMSACKHISTSLMQLLLDPEVRQISMGALHQLHVDIKECEGEFCTPLISIHFIRPYKFNTQNTGSK